MTYWLQTFLFGLCSRVVLALCLWLSSILEIVPFALKLSSLSSLFFFRHHFNFMLSSPSNVVQHCDDNITGSSDYSVSNNNRVRIFHQASLLTLMFKYDWHSLDCHRYFWTDSHTCDCGHVHLDKRLSG